LRLHQVSIVIATAALACGGRTPRSDDAPRNPEAISLLGVPLYAARDTTGIIALADQQLAAKPRDLTRLINAGIARASVRRFNAAIEIFSRAIEMYPNEARLYRFRGHRYLSLRRFEDAVKELQHAVFLDSTNYDIAYHLALAYFLTQRYAEAASAIERCMAFADDPKWQAVEESRVNPVWHRSCMSVKTDDDARAAMLDWRYRALRRAGKHADARRLVRGVREGWTVGENAPYYRALLFYRGVRAETSTLDSLSAAGELSFVTGAYGVANWHLMEGDTARARALFEQVVSGTQWPAFGFIGAEVDLARMKADTTTRRSSSRTPAWPPDGRAPEPSRASPPGLGRSDHSSGAPSVRSWS
jgi:tetratricopeptide (TPR) repeat protein